MAKEFGKIIASIAVQCILLVIIQMIARPWESARNALKYDCLDRKDENTRKAW